MASPRSLARRVLSGGLIAGCASVFETREYERLAQIFANEVALVESTLESLEWVDGDGNQSVDL